SCIEQIVELSREWLAVRLEGMERGRTCLWLHKQWYTKINGVPPHDVIFIQKCLAPLSRKVENASNVILLKNFSQSALILLWKLDDFNRDVTLCCGFEMFLKEDKRA